MLPLRTERLVLRELTPADHDAVVAYRATAENSRYLGYDGTVPAEMEGWWERTMSQCAKGTRFAVAIELDGRLIGDGGFRVSEAPSVAGDTGEREGYLNYAFDPAYGGQGYATETARAMLLLGFEHLGLRRITAEVFGGHDASSHILRKVGMRHEGTSVRKVFNREGGWYDDEHYALLREEWRAQQA